MSIDKFEKSTEMFDVYAASILGTREEQQDATLVKLDGARLIAAVCDGMGGLSNGSLASNTAINKLSELYCNRGNSTDWNHFFIDSIDILDESVVSLKNQSSTKSATGTTIVSVVIDRDKLYWLSVGDSRLYIIRDKEIACVTTDHNYYLILNDMLQNGEITQAEYTEKSKKGEALVSCLGMGGIELMDTNSVPFKVMSKDVIILTSDGLYRCLSDEEIFRIAVKESSAKKTTCDLIEAASRNVKKHQDNTSVITIRVK